MIFYPEVSSNQAFNGTEQMRFFEVKGDRLQYKTTPFVSGISGKKMVGTLIWDRVK